MFRYSYNSSSSCSFTFLKKIPQCVQLNNRVSLCIQNQQSQQNIYLRSFSSSKSNDDSNNKFHDKTPLSVAIVGSGPSGLYTSKYLRSSFLQKIQEEIESSSSSSSSFANYKLEIDVFERLPTPYGLVRFGVAPDHQEVKNVENDFASLFQNDDDDGTSIEYFGNVSVGTDVSVEELTTMYDAVILAYGCDIDKKLGIEGEDNLSGVVSAREFVAWYNGHPDYVFLGEKIKEMLHTPNPSVAKVVIIGQGNVALDCARILAKGGNGLRQTDIASHAIPILKDGVGGITVLGRRGHVQGAFTIKELRELTKLKEEYNADFRVNEHELNLGITDATKEELSSPKARPKIRIDKLLRDVASTSFLTDDDDNDSNTSAFSFQDMQKCISLRFLLQPMKFLPQAKDSTKIGYVQCQQTKLTGDAFQQNAIATDKTEIFEADLVIVSIGYKSIPLKGMEHNKEVFDISRGRMNHNRGKVISNEDTNLYVSGWVKRGANGIIGTNIPDAKETVDTIMNDFTHVLNSSTGDTEKFSSSRNKIIRILKERQVNRVDWNAYEKINQAELSHGKGEGIREKIVNVDDMLTIIQNE